MTTWAKIREEMACFALLPKGWPFSGAVDAMETNPLSLAIVEDFNSVPINDSDHFTREGKGVGSTEKQEEHQEGNSLSHGSDE